MLGASRPLGGKEGGKCRSLRSLSARRVRALRESATLRVRCNVDYLLRSTKKNPRIQKA